FHPRSSSPPAFLFFHASVPHPYLLSFPTRRSSDLALFFTDQPPTATPYMLRLGRQDLDIAAGQRDYVNADSYRLPVDVDVLAVQDRKSTRLNCSHRTISYAVFCLKKKNNKQHYY